MVLMLIPMDVVATTGHRWTSLRTAALPVMPGGLVISAMSNVCTDHPFGTVSVDADNTILCGVCGITMGYVLYARTHSCPHCGHGFNPGCALHKELYFHT